MTKTLALAASMVLLVAISGRAFAGSGQLNARSLLEAAGPVDRETANASNVLEQERTTRNSYRYHGGPKSND